ncbi:MAG TPA: lysoplasmalogenase [Saprospiraceae bacterium]|nr:lysoplasmalogenase [Saprospiraceae bacterium]
MSIDKNILPIQYTQRIQLILNAAVILMAACTIFFLYEDEKFIYRICKPITTVLLIFMVFTLGNKSVKPFHSLMSYAFIFCLIGDVLLMFESAFIFGLLSFLIAHLLFFKAFTSKGGLKKQYGVLMVLLAIGLAIFTYLFPYLGSLKIPVILYVLAILCMCWQGIGLYLQDQQLANKFLMVGVLLFLFSDAILAINKFAHQFPLADFLILSSYWGALLCIANGVVLVKTDYAS